MNSKSGLTDRQLNISYKKCNVLCLSNQKSPQIDLVLSDSMIPQVDSVRDLGVIMDNRLRFDIHIHQIVLVLTD